MRQSLAVGVALASILLAGWARTHAASQETGDPVRGKEAFARRCGKCHSLTENREGPRLAGVFGRTAGTVEGFAYSEPLQKAAFAWDEARMERWLADPDAVVPGTDMELRVVNAQERSDLIAYLRTLR